MQSWGARLKAALSGEVDGGDVRSLLAAAAPLERLQQMLADRRLEAEIANIGREWQAAVDLAPVAGSLWLAEALTTLGGALVDAEAEAHQDRSTLLSAISHRQALGLLEPVGPLLVDVSATLADPGRRPSVSLPVLVGRQAATVDASVPTLPLAYVRGLLLGLDRLEGATTQALEVTAALVGRSPAPAWLTAGMQRLRGDLAALDTRLEVVRVQAAALLANSAADSGALHQLAGSLWSSIDVLLDVGQAACAPLLLPGAQALPVPRPPAPPARAQGSAAPAASPAPVPAPPVRPGSSQVPSPPPPAPTPEELPRTLPEIMPAWQPATSVDRQMPGDEHLGEQSAAADHRALPEIVPGAMRRGDGQSLADEHAERVSPLPEQARPLPRIDEADRMAKPRERVETAPQQTSRHAQATGAAHGPGETSGTGRHIDRKDRWLLSSSAARHRLRASGGEEDAERQLAAFWEARSWTLSAAAGGYLDQIAALAAQGTVAPSGRSLVTPPYAPIYRVTSAGATLFGQRLAPGTLVAFDYARDRLLQPSAQEGVAD